MYIMNTSIGIAPFIQSTIKNFYIFDSIFNSSSFCGKYDYSDEQCEEKYYIDSIEICGYENEETLNNYFKFLEMKNIEKSEKCLFDENNSENFIENLDINVIIGSEIVFKGNGIITREITELYVDENIDTIIIEKE